MCIRDRSIDSYLKGSARLSDEVVHLLFSANRWEFKTELIEEVKRNKTILLDRYAYSGVAYTSAKGLDIEWCKNCDRGLPKPDLVFFMEVDEETSSKRGDFGKELYEKKEFQQIVKEKYNTLFEPNWIRINAGQTQEAVFQDILREIENYTVSGKNVGELEKLWVQQ
eukprot:TRINITY_DN3191_c0_g1_i5.p1 TRINITY_DN3191_c0_g1~~TRINITY_DN3191_c0_g1_i5.p1  ORF type:complete len:196 (+),score=65.46 TRINITY_DN3191_c0_g1_i5:90-590(+)